MKYFPLLLLFAFITSEEVCAQKLVVSYDYLKDDFTYYKVRKGKKKLIDRAVVGRKSDIKVEVKNFNPFVYTAKAGFQSLEVNESPNISFFSLLSPMPLTASGTSFLDKIQEESETRAGTATGLLADGRMSKLYSNMQQAYGTLYEAEQELLNVDYAIQKLNELKYNTYLPADSIKSYCNQLLNIILHSEQVNAGDFIAFRQDITARISEGKSSFSMARQSFSNQAEMFALDKGIDAKQDMAFQLAQNLQNTANGFSNYYTDEQIALKLNQLERLYQSIIHTNFNFNAGDVSEGDEMTLVLDFYKNQYDENGEPLVSLDNLESLNKVKSKKVHITVKNDVKINSSVGLAFPSYRNNSDFINKDGVITSVSGNNFTPNMAAFMNFYPYSGRNANLGGTFGLGFPLGNDVRNLNVMMGFSGILGSTNKVVLHAGASLGQVNQLDQGFKVGDTLPDIDDEVPVKQAYQWGVFAGISFSIANIRN